MNVALCIPTRANISQKSFYPLLGAAMGMTQWTMGKFSGGVFLCSSARAHAGDARNVIVQKVMESDAEWTLWLDDDAVPPPDVFPRLMKWEKKIVVPIHRQKEPPYRCPAWRFDAGGKKEMVPLEPPGLIQISHCGMHCALIHRSVLEAAVKATGEKGPFQVHPGVSEDCFFFQLANKLGFDVWMDTTFTVDHVKETTVEEERQHYEA